MTGCYVMQDFDLMLHLLIPSDWYLKLIYPAAHHPQSPAQSWAAATKWQSNNHDQMLQPEAQHHWCPNNPASSSCSIVNIIMSFIRTCFSVTTNAYFFFTLRYNVLFMIYKSKLPLDLSLCYVILMQYRPHNAMTVLHNFVAKTAKWSDHRNHNVSSHEESPMNNIKIASSSELHQIS